MNSHILASEIASEHHRELINQAAGWRRGRAAKQAARARRALAQARNEPAVYCRRAAAQASHATRCPA